MPFDRWKTVLTLLCAITLFSCNKTRQASSKAQSDDLDLIVTTDSCRHTDTSFRCVKYVSNYDGDTITFNIPRVPKILGDKISIRVLGLDTPEIKTEDSCEKEASLIAKEVARKEVAEAERIDLIDVSRGKYFRVVADVIIDKRKSLTKILLEKGLAYRYEGGTKIDVDWCPIVENYNQPAE